MLEYWKKTPLGRDGGSPSRRSIRPPSPTGSGAGLPDRRNEVEEAAPVAQRATLPEPVFGFFHHSNIPLFQHSTEVRGNL